MKSNRSLLTIAALFALVFLAGCEKALFPPNLPRSQYERFTYQREGISAAQEESILGGAIGGAPGGGEIDLRTRLRPLSER